MSLCVKSFWAEDKFDLKSHVEMILGSNMFSRFFPFFCWLTWTPISTSYRDSSGDSGLVGQCNHFNSSNGWSMWHKQLAKKSLPIRELSHHVKTATVTNRLSHLTATTHYIWPHTTIPFSLSAIMMGSHYLFSAVRPPRYFCPSRNLSCLAKKYVTGFKCVQLSN